MLLSPFNKQSLHPSHDDLGAPPTWRPYSWKKRRTLLTRQYTASVERSVVFHLILVTLAGDEIQLPIELQEFDRLGEFENAVIESLPLIGKHSTFGCELEFVSMSAQRILADPIWDTLHECNCFSLVVRRCFIQAEHKGQLRQRAKAISVPAEDNDRVLPNVSDSKSSSHRTLSFACRTVCSKDATSSELFLSQDAKNSDAACLRNAAPCPR